MQNHNHVVSRKLLVERSIIWN